MSERVVIGSGAVKAQVFEGSRDVERIINKALSYHVYGSEHMNEKGAATGWDGMSSFYSFRKKQFPAGFARSVVTSLRKKGYNVIWKQRQAPEPLGPLKPKVDDFPEDPRYSYQPETVNRLVKYQKIIAKAATGAGKSRIARLAHKRIGRKTLFLTTRGILMHQMKEGYEESIGEKAGIVGDGEWDEVNGFNVGMVQTLAQALEPADLKKETERYFSNKEAELDRDVERIKRARKRQGFALGKIMDEIADYRDKFNESQPSSEEIEKIVRKRYERQKERNEKALKFLETVDLLILEEAHETGSDSYYKVCNACKNAMYRLALTGTAFQKSQAEDNMRLMAVSGPIGIIISEKLLIDRGILATPKFMFRDVTAPTKLYRSTGYQRAYKFGIVENQLRNEDAVMHATHLSSFGLTSMMLVGQKNHGKILKSMLEDAGLRAEFILGENSQKQRQAALNKLGQGKIDVLIGTTILDVGVDVPSVGAVFLLGGGKDEVSHRQRIGRGLRAKKSGPNICFVFDYLDRKNKHLKEHAATRLKIIKDTPGFRENIVENLEPEKFGFERAA